MQNNSILIIKVNVEQTKFDPGAVDAQVYCVNISTHDLEIEMLNQSFTTIDDDSGLTAQHGTSNHKFILKPNEVKLIAQVCGWEWDGHVGVEIKFNEVGSNLITKNSYDLKSSKQKYYIESLNLHGRIVEPLK